MSRARLRGTAGWIYFLSFSPDGRWLASTGQNGAVAQVWDMQASPPKVFPLRSSLANSAKAGAISPEGAWLATVTSGNKLVLLWNYQTQDATPVMLQSNEALLDDTVAFSTDGRWLAAVDQTNAIHIWDTTDLGTEPLVLRGHNSRIFSLAFDPEQRWLATGSENGAVRLWDLDMVHLQSEACWNVGRNLTWQEWDQYFSAEPIYRTTCPEYPVHPSVVQRQLEEGDIAWQAGDQAAAMARFQQAAAWDSSVDPDQAADASKLKAYERLIGEGQRLASQGDLETAFARFDQALRLDPKAPIDELHAQAQANAFRWLIDTAVQLLKSDQIQQAIEKLAEAVKLSDTFDAGRIKEIRSKAKFGIVVVSEEESMLLSLASKAAPEVAAREFAAAFLLQLGRNVWGWPKKSDDSFDVQYAIAKFELAKSLDPSLDLDPENEARRRLIDYWLEGSDSLSDSGSYQYQAGRVHKAVELIDPNLDLPAETWNSVCWFGSLYGFAAQVADSACEKAVVLAAESDAPDFHDSRGLARALTERCVWAISDFQVFVNQRAGPEADARTAWIRRLTRGEVPATIFSSEMLSCLISANCNPSNFNAAKEVQP